MRFSEHFKITQTAMDDWFDPHLTVDTKLFVDPLLVLKKGTSAPWVGAHDELIEHFVSCYRLIASAPTPTSHKAKRAQVLLRFPEPGEFCLGYTARGTNGSGGGKDLARRMADGIAIALAAGLSSPEHIEELGILNVGIGADRISDAICNVLKARFIKYTQSVAKRHGVSLEAHRVQNATVYITEGRWMAEEVLLPTNPGNGKPILLAPKRFLNDLPILNVDDWFDSNLNDDVRAQLNLSVSQRVTKASIVEVARRHPDRVREWAREAASEEILDGYDFEDDPKGVVHWDSAGRDAAAAMPIPGVTAVTTQEQLRDLLVEMLNNFKRFVEHQRGWSLLWDSSNNPKPEEAAQLLFLGMAHHYFRMFNIELDREVDLGRGPVDFKLSKGTSVRMLLEMKKAENGKFWNGLDQQLPSYLTSDDAEEGWFVALRYSSTKAAKAKVEMLPARVRATSAATGKDIRFMTIDARRKVSASKLTDQQP